MRRSNWPSAKSEQFPIRCCAPRARRSGRSRPPYAALCRICWTPSTIRVVPGSRRTRSVSGCAPSRTTSTGRSGTCSTRCWRRRAANSTVTKDACPFPACGTRPVVPITPACAASTWTATRSCSRAPV